MTEPTMRLAGQKQRSMPRRISLTKRAVESIPTPPVGKRTTVYDNTTPGLAIVVGAESRTWWLITRFRGRAIRVKLERFPKMTPEQAQKAAREKMGEISKGIDPRKERQAITESATLEQVWQRWGEDAKLRHRPRTIETDRSRYEKHLAGWKNRKIGAITGDDVCELHNSIGRKIGKTTANRVVQLLRRLFNFARLKPNPAGEKSVRFFDEEDRERFLQGDELPRFFAALELEPNDTLRDFFITALFTGQRRANVQAMAWSELHLDSRTWTIPGEKMKNGRPHRVHLPEPLIEILSARREQAAQRALAGDVRFAKGFVFPSHRRDAKTPHLTEAKGAWRKLLERADLKDLRIHDLRRSLGSWAAMTGASLPIIGKALGHLDQTSTAIYARLNIDPVRLAAETAVSAMRAAGGARDENEPPTT